MKRKYIKDIKAGEEVLLRGWVYELRSLAKLKFLLLRDASGFVQCVGKNDNVIKKLKEKTIFNITEQSLENLKSEKLPIDIIDKLENIKNHVFTDEDKFLENLKSTIEDEH